MIRNYVEENNPDLILKVWGEKGEVDGRILCPDCKREWFCHFSYWFNSVQPNKRCVCGGRNLRWFPL